MTATAAGIGTGVGAGAGALGWVAIVRLGLVQAAIGSVVVLTTSTFNRVMAVELALPAVLPGLLVGLHYGVQLTRPHWGFRSDARGGRTPFVVGGMALLAAGGLGAAGSVALLQSSLVPGLLAAVLAYAAIGLGVGASGTSLLALLATATDPRRRAAAATITWLMMIAGIAITAVLAGGRLDPYSHARLLAVTAAVCAFALTLTVVAVAGIERRLGPAPEPEPTRFREGLAEVWAEPRARRFTVFVFVSMTAYFMQELILEPYAGQVFGMTPGQSTQLSGAQNGGVFLGMVAVAVAVTGLRLGGLRAWVAAGCLGSAASLLAIAALGRTPEAPLTPAVVSLGFFNGVFAVAAIGSMMQLAGRGRERREGTRMGLWGAAQAIAAGLGGLIGTALVDVLRLTTPAATAFGTVFAIEAALFVLAAAMAVRATAQPATVPGE